MDYNSKLATAGLGSNYANESNLAARITFADPVTEARQRSATVLVRVSELEDRLCGSPKTDAAKTGTPPQPVPNGIFEQIENNARNTVADLNDIEAAITRILNALPA
jgi:hypothetical protein